MTEALSELSTYIREARPSLVEDVVLVDPDASWTVNGAQLASIAGNTPFEGMELPAAVTATILRGRVTALAGRIAR